MLGDRKLEALEGWAGDFALIVHRSRIDRALIVHRSRIDRASITN
jgi:hypothetical protein